VVAVSLAPGDRVCQIQGRGAVADPHETAARLLPTAAEAVEPAVDDVSSLELSDRQSTFSMQSWSIQPTRRLDDTALVIAVSRAGPAL
jgi:hypothetical protein